MKNGTLQKVILMTTALAASLALSAQAGQRAPKPEKTSGSAGAHQIHIPAVPLAPQVILYDQYDNAGANATSSQDFEASFDPFDDFLADDFAVPSGQTWSVESVDADGVYFNGFGPAINFNVVYYSDAGGLPGAVVASRIASSYVQVGSTFTISMSPAVSLTAGTYWVSIQARMDFSAGGQWGWTDRSVQSNNAASWENPGGGFGVCTTWGRRGDDCGIDPGVPDQVFRLNGTTEGGGGGITLDARVRRQGDLRAVTLSWTPADGGEINVLRDGNVVQMTADDGMTRDKLNHRTGSFTYQVCETDSGDCSNEVTITVD